MRFQIFVSDGVYMLEDPDTYAVRGTYWRESESGWWKGVDPYGRPRRLWVSPDTTAPHLEIAQRLIHE